MLYDAENSMRNVILKSLFVLSSGFFSSLHPHTPVSDDDMTMVT